MDAIETVVTPESAPDEYTVNELRAEILEAIFLKALSLGQVTGEIGDDPSRDETIEFAARHVGKIWDDYQVFKNEQATNTTEAEIVQEEPKDAPSA